MMKKFLEFLFVVLILKNRIFKLIKISTELIEDSKIN